MPLNLEALPLDPDPTSVRKARTWVREVLSDLRRDDIVNAAEQGVSELVTNAILHGTPPITVRVRGTRDHPRVEIRDSSSRPPTVNVDMTEEENLLSTFGRGLGLVALHSAAWGADLTPEGKVVWFEPSAQPPSGDLDGEVFDLERAVQGGLADTDAPTELLRIRLLDLPVELYTRFRRRFYELARELRLLALAHGDDYPVASELAEVFLEAEQVRLRGRGFDDLDALLASGVDRGDVEVFVPLDAPEILMRLLDRLERADEFCRQQRLLVLAATPLELALQRWFFPEFSRQAAGGPPRPWPGPFVVDDASSEPS